MTHSAPEFIVYPQLESSNLEMKRLASKQQLAEYSLVITPNQTAGHGQAGNSWESEKDKNLTFSILLRPGFLAPHLQFCISKVVSLAIIDTLKTLGIESSIKWPNDIYIEDSKVAGILIENSIFGHRLEYSIVGIGLNVNQEQFVSDAPNPISLIQHTKLNHRLDDVLESLVDQLEHRYHQLETDRTALIDTEYMNALYRKDGTHLFRDEHGEFEASIDTVNEMGLLTLVDTVGTKREYAFKEVGFVL
ncbi:biotin--[acetyl-CoA-carboxylase] ligase [Carboxylicivirga sp. M1479]|uniref:biotin--[acetyl-CoA-carboxylase] ligase n=1 Tax=Carboxylicivirga sp. M1479 TaxID=2594476 RepID=UPI001177DFAC|nr:biotin--[acetyl-CoA-carboxylase] ligase [Carboxylicivirga sp. M1479]TRX71056.1 biotin--[acetyl-CoA-carboxylase] ligase [Carboxylicivirga sp. M1479]